MEHPYWFVINLLGGQSFSFDLFWICAGDEIKKTGREFLLVRFWIGGGYRLSHFRSTIGVVRFNFSVRNGKRWSPHAIATLSRLLSVLRLQ